MEMYFAAGTSARAAMVPHRNEGVALGVETGRAAFGDVVRESHKPADASQSGIAPRRRAHELAFLNAEPRHVASIHQQYVAASVYLPGTDGQRCRRLR